MKTKGKNLSQLWKRNMVVAAIAVFVCAAVYLNWNYEQEVGKTLGESAMVGKEDPLVSGGGSSAPGSDGSGQTGQSDGAVLCEGLGSGWGRPLQLHRHRDAHPLSVQKPDGERSGLALPVGPGKQIEGPGPIGVVLHRQGIGRTLRPGEGPGPAQVHGLPGGEGVLPEEPQGPASRVCVPYSTQCSSSIFRSSPGRGAGSYTR